MSRGQGDRHPSGTASIPAQQPLGWRWIWREQVMLNPKKQEGNGCLGNRLDLAQMPGRQRGEKGRFLGKLCWIQVTPSVSSMPLARHRLLFSQLNGKSSHFSV